MLQAQSKSPPAKAALPEPAPPEPAPPEPAPPDAPADIVAVVAVEAWQSNSNCIALSKT